MSSFGLIGDIWQFGAILGCSWIIWDYFGPFQTILGNFVPFWLFFHYLGLFLAFLCSFGPYQANLGFYQCLDPFWLAMGRFRTIYSSFGSFRIVLDQLWLLLAVYRLFEVTLDYLKLLRAILDHFRLFQAISDCLVHILNIYVSNGQFWGISNQLRLFQTIFRPFETI